MNPQLQESTNTIQMNSSLTDSVTESKILVQDN